MIRILTAGESHGVALTGIVEGLPAGITVRASDIDLQLARRWLGFGRGGRSKIEKDRIRILSGVRFEKTIGSPVALHLENAAHLRDRAQWDKVLAVEGQGTDVDPITLPRPGHADLVGVQKFGFADIRPVIERASARETAIRVACCTLARLLLKEFGILVGSHVIRIGEVGFDTASQYEQGRDKLLSAGATALSDVADRSDVRMIDPSLSKVCIEHISDTKKAGDSLGGAYEVVVTGVPPGLGSYTHWDRKLDGLIGQAILSIQGQKAVEIGDGFDGARTLGSNFHDPIVVKENEYLRSTNHAGGIEGGMSNGMPIIVRGYMKPIPTLIKPLETVDIATGEPLPTRYERSDVTSVPAASTVAESVVALVIANALIEKFGGDSIDEIHSRFGE